MCYNKDTKLEEKDIVQLEHDFALNWTEEEHEDYYSVSGFSHPKIPVITENNEVKLYNWGLIPAWVKDWKTATDLRKNTLNAMGETIDTKPSFKGAVKAGRFCIIPVKGFYEWHHHTNKEKYPHYIYPKDGSYFRMAGLYEQWENPALDEVYNTFTMVTTEANERMQWIHNVKKRMPVILTTNEAKLWLDRGISFAEKQKLIDPFESEFMADHTISKLITSRKENPNRKEVSMPFIYPELSR